MAAAVLADEILTAESKRALIEAWPLCCNGKGSNAAAGVRAPVCCRSSVIDSPKRLATKPPWLDMNTRLPVTAAPNSESTANDPLALELVSSLPQLEGVFVVAGSDNGFARAPRARSTRWPENLRR
jgi:hypothetical protein